MKFLSMLMALGVVITAGLTVVLKYLAKTGWFHAFLEQGPINVPPEPQNTHQEPVSVPVPTRTPPVDKVRLFCLAHQNFEGYYPGSTAYVHKNPGNLKNTDGSWKTFPTYEAGFAALEDYVRRVAEGKHSAYPKGGNTTIREYTHIYAPDPEPIPTNYAKTLSTAVGTTPDQKMSWLLS